PTLSLHDALPIFGHRAEHRDADVAAARGIAGDAGDVDRAAVREHRADDLDARVVGSGRRVARASPQGDRARAERLHRVVDVLADAPVVAAGGAVAGGAGDVDRAGGAGLDEAG